MHLCTTGFLEKISFDEVYINKVEKYKKNGKQYDIANLFKEIRRIKQEMSLEERIKGLEKKVGKQMTKALMIIFEIIAVVFLVFACFWWSFMDDYKEFIKLSDFTKDLVSAIQSFFIVMTIVFSFSGGVLYLMSFGYEESVENEFREKD